MNFYTNPNEEQMKELFQHYLSCFQKMDLEGLKAYVAENVYFYWGDEMPPLIGRDMFFNFFQNAWGYFTEKPVASEIEVKIPILRAKIHNRIEVYKDWPNGPFEAFGTQMKKGDVVEDEGYVNYVFNEKGKIAIIIDADYSNY